MAHAAGGGLPTTTTAASGADARGERGREGVGSFVTYTHYYDQSPGLCHADGPWTASHSRKRYKDWMRVHGIFKQWRADRIRNELFLHVLHATGLIRWVQ